MNRDAVVAWIRERIGEATGLGNVDPTVPFAHLGLDSARLATLAGELEDAFGVRLDVGLAYENPTPAELADALARQAADADPTAHSGKEDGEPVAVVGIGCRLPGATGPGELWDLLLQGRDAVAEPGDVVRPDGPWPDPAGLLVDIDRFDAGFFGIPAGEAARIDPQQRLLLEVAWEALEDAGAVPADLRGSATGVWVGIATQDYLYRQLAEGAGDVSMPTGTSLAVAANRLSFGLDLRGPSLSVDTACSSSLVALHLAAAALRAGEVERALVGGVNALLEPGNSASLARAGMLSPTGRCRAFGAAADGYVRAEGCCVVVLEPLAAARRAGHRVYAVVRGAAVGQDGRSNGLTAPNPAAQRSVIAAAHRVAGIGPGAVDYVEAHGTGTPLGDPIEAEALAAVVGRCRLGSVKSNLGHLEAAAGVAGVAKVALALHHGTIPPTLHASPPNPRVDLDALGLELVTSPTAWHRAGADRLAGVSSFGFGGTNAHVVLGGVDADTPAPPPPGPLVLPLSAPTERGLAELVSRWRTRLDDVDPAELADLCATAAHRRTHHRHRAAFVGAEIDAVLPQSQAGRVGLVFSGQGGAWDGSASALLDASPLAVSVVRRCDEAADGVLDWSIEQALWGGADMADNAVAQPLRFACQLALAALVRSLGLVPAAVVGHSLGEISAAVTAGVLDLPDAMRLVVRRGELLARPEAAGRMLAARHDPADAAAYTGADVAIAALNGPRDVVFSGDPAALSRLHEELPQSRWLATDRAFHSPRVHALAAELGDDIRAHAGDIPWFSTVTGGLVRGDEIAADHWQRNVRAPVRFHDALTAMAPDLVVEVSPERLLRGPLRDFRPLAITADPASLAPLAAGLYEAGVDVDWVPVLGPRRPVVSLPLPPWEPTRFWVPAATGPTAAPVTLPGRRVDLAGHEAWEARLDPAAMPVLADHELQGRPVLPATASVELALGVVGRPQPGETCLVLEDLELRRMTHLDQGGVDLQTWRDGDRVTVHTRSGAGRWEQHASFRGELRRVPPTRSHQGARGGIEGAGEPGPAVYARLRSRGLAYGPGFAGVTMLWRDGDRAHGALGPPAGPDLAVTRAVDTGLHVLAGLPAFAGPGGTIAPTAMRLVRVWSDPVRSVAASAAPADDGTVDVTLWDDAGDAAVELAGIRLTTLAPAAADEPTTYQIAWRPQALTRERSAPAGPWLVWDEDAALADPIAAALVGAGARPTRVRGGSMTPGQALRQAADATVGPLSGVVHVVTADGQAHEPTARVLAMVQAVSRLSQSTLPVLTIVTKGAHAVGTGREDPVAPAATALWSLLKSVQIEHPLLRWRLIDADGHPDSAAALVREVSASTPEAEVAVRAGERFVRRLVAGGGQPDHCPRWRPLVTDPDAAYLVTGGTGALGAQVARHLAEHGAQHLVLATRRSNDRRAAEAVARVAAAGGEATVVAVDVADRDALAVALDGIRDERPVRGVVHAAGVLDDGPFMTMTEDSLRDVFAGKAAGAWNLHELTAEDAVDLFVLFSSAAGQLGSPGQGNYAAASGFIDGLAHRRRQQGQPALAVDWGPWAGRGMAAVTGGTESRRRLRSAVNDLEPSAALAALDRLVATGGAQACVLAFDLRHLLQFYPTDLPPFFDEVGLDDAAALKSIGVVQTRERPRMAVAYEPPRGPVEQRIVEIWQRALGVAPVGVLDSFFELGGDSVFANQILLEVSRALGVEVPAEEAFEDLTVAHLAAVAEREMAARVEAMSDEEVAAMLGAEAST